MAIRLIALMRRNRTLLFILFILFLIVTIVLKSLTTTSSLSGGGDGDIVCNQLDRAKEKEHMKVAFVRTIAALKSLNLPHFLCYDSLWAALSGRNKAFDWKSLNEICLSNEDVSNVEEATLIRSFRREGLKLTYFSSTGEYEVKLEDDEDQITRIKMFLFERDLMTDNMRRVGWKHRILLSDSCSILHCFPPHLLDKNLPTVSFNGIEVTVPKEGMEIQKYRYPDNWWRSSREPYECTTNMR